MKQIKYTGIFKNSEGEAYQLDVYGFGFIQAFFLLTADAIRAGKNYQLDTITANDDSLIVIKVDNISKVSALLS